MGITHVDLFVANPLDPSREEAIRLLVDSGATFSVVPAAVLERLGIPPLAEEIFRLANGDKITRKRGGAAFKFNNKVGVADVIFGEPDDMSLLGVLTLESLGLALDPLKRELRDLPMLMAHHSTRVTEPEA